MFCIFTDIEMPFHWKRKDVLCVGVCSITVEQDCASCICEGVFKTVANSNAELSMAQKIQRGRLFVQIKRSGQPKHQKRRSEVFVKNLAKPQKIVTKNKSENQDSFNNSLAHPEETFDNETQQDSIRSDHNSRGQWKAQNFLC